MADVCALFFYNNNIMQNFRFKKPSFYSASVCDSYNSVFYSHIHLLSSMCHYITYYVLRADKPCAGFLLLLQFMIMSDICITKVYNEVSIASMYCYSSSSSTAIMPLLCQCMLSFLSQLIKQQDLVASKQLQMPIGVAENHSCGNTDL